MQIFSLRRSLLCIAVLAVSGCGFFGDDEEPEPAPPPPPPPTILSLELEASPNVNPDVSGQAKPVSVKVFQLASVNDFLGADFFSLYQDASGELGRDLGAEDSFVLAPGSRLNYQREIEAPVRFVGITVAYRSIDSAQWRAWKEIVPNKTNLFRAIIGANGVEIREALK